MDLSRYIPSITSFGPTSDLADVPVEPVIWARFSIEIDRTQVEGDLLINAVTLLVAQGPARMVPVAFVSYQDRTLSFRPAVPLVPGETYQITILGKIQTAGRRQMGVDRTWSFTVAQTPVAGTRLLAPADRSAVGTNPTLSWTAVPRDPSFPAGTLLRYRVELDATPEFATVDTAGWTSLVVGTSVLPGVPFPPGHTYWWRVTPEALEPDGTRVPGPSSEIRSFWQGTPAAPSPSTQVAPTPDGPFLVTGAGFDDGASDLAAWPRIAVTLSQPPASGSVDDATVYLTRRAVDQEPQTAVTRVAGALATEGATIVFVPAGAPAPNSRYTLILDGVLDLAGDPLPRTERYFTSRYSPLYAGVLALRGDFGHLLGDVPDDFICFHIYRASLDANRHYIRYYQPQVNGITGFGGGPSETMVRNVTFPLPYAIERWTEIEAAIRITQAILRDAYATAGDRVKLGDYEQETRAEKIRYLQGEIQNLRRDQAVWTAEFSKKKAHTRWVRKSESYQPWRTTIDWSRRDRPRF